MVISVDNHRARPVLLNALAQMIEYVNDVPCCSVLRIHHSGDYTHDNEIGDGQQRAETGVPTQRVDEHDYRTQKSRPDGPL